MESYATLFTTHDWPFVSQPDSSLHLPSTPLDATDPKPSCRTRSQMPGNVLFFDRLLILAAIEDYASLYPPANLSTLQSLLKAIQNCPFDSLSQSLFLFLQSLTHSH